MKSGDLLKEGTRAEESERKSPFTKRKNREKERTDEQRAYKKAYVSKTVCDQNTWKNTKGDAIEQFACTSNAQRVQLVTRHLVSHPPSDPPPTHLYRETADQHHGGRANDLGTVIKRHLLADQASPSSATAAVERPPPIEERREDENDATSTEHGGGRPQRREEQRGDKEQRREPPGGDTSRLSRGKPPREPWRKRGGERQRKEGYNLFMAHQARNKGRGKGGPSDSWYS